MEAQGQGGFALQNSVVLKSKTETKCKIQWLQIIQSLRAAMNLGEAVGDQDSLCQICRNKKSNTTLHLCHHAFCLLCIIRWLKKHKVCPICHQIASVILHNGRAFTIKKRRVATWKPQSHAPEISIIFKGMHHQLFQGDTDSLLPLLQAFLNNVVCLSIRKWRTGLEGHPRRGGTGSME